MPNRARPLGVLVSTRYEVHAETPFSATAVRPPGTWRYNVEALHPTCRATSAAVMVPDASIAFAAVTLMASNAGGRPPTRPRARLAASAVRVRSRKSSTSNCPRAAKIWRISRPVALVVSMFSCSDRKPMPRACKVSTVDRSWRMDRARRSRRWTTRTSPSRANSNAAASRSSIPRTPARTRQHGGHRSDHRWFADRSRPAHSRPTSEVSQNSSYPRAIETRVSGLSSGTLHCGFQGGIGTNRGFSRIRTFIGGCPDALEQSIQPRPLVAPPGVTDPSSRIWGLLNTPTASASVLLVQPVENSRTGNLRRPMRTEPRQCQTSLAVVQCHGFGNSVPISGSATSGFR